MSWIFGIPGRVYVSIEANAAHVADHPIALPPQQHTLFRQIYPPPSHHLPIRIISVSSIAEPFPSPVKATVQKIERIPNFCLLPTCSVVSSVSGCVLVHCSDSMSRSISSSMMSFTIHVSLSLSSLNFQLLSLHIIPLNQCTNLHHVAFHFPSAFHSTYLPLTPANTGGLNPSLPDAK